MTHCPFCLTSTVGSYHTIGQTLNMKLLAPFAGQFGGSSRIMKIRIRFQKYTTRFRHPTLPLELSIHLRGWLCHTFRTLTSMTCDGWLRRTRRRSCEPMRSIPKKKQKPEELQTRRGPADPDPDPEPNPSNPWKRSRAFWTLELTLRTSWSKLERR